MDLLEDLAARGLVHDHTDLDALAERLSAGPLTLYHGIDPTADSLHTGNLIGVLALRRFQQAGHRPIALAGGATGMVGDPSGRSDERVLLDEETLRSNVAAIERQLERLLDFGDGSDRALLVDNHSWTKDLTLIEFLRQVGKSFTVNSMVAKESVRSRMAGDQGISFTEFSYMLLQANDYLWLHDHHGCELQIGGSDQWGNITAGIDLVRRRRGAAVHGLTWPLLLGAGGEKLGKSTGARVWLDPEKTTPYRFFQHWMQEEDAVVGDRLRQLTFLPVPDVDELMARHSERPERREAQSTLARHVTSLVHGGAAAAAAEEASSILFGGDVAEATPETLSILEGELDTTVVPADHLEAGVLLVDLLVDTGLVTSRSEARRHLEQGGIYVNGERAGGEDPAVGTSHLRHGRWILLRKGKRTYHLVRSEG